MIRWWKERYEQLNSTNWGSMFPIGGCLINFGDRCFQWVRDYKTKKGDIYLLQVRVYKFFKCRMVPTTII